MPKAIVIAGTSSGCGKTSVTLGLMKAFARKGLVVQGFKSGPDFIDPGLHRMASGLPSHNLDGWMLSADEIHRIFRRNHEGLRHLHHRRSHGPLRRHRGRQRGRLGRAAGQDSGRARDAGGQRPGHGPLGGGSGQGLCPVRPGPAPRLRALQHDRQPHARTDSGPGHGQPGRAGAWQPATPGRSAPALAAPRAGHRRRPGPPRGAPERTGRLGRKIH